MVRGMVDFSFTEEQELFRRTLRGWLAKNLTLEKSREIDTKQEIPMEIIKGLADLGVLLPTIPEEHGGAGADWVTATMIAEELGYHDLSIATPPFYLIPCSWGFVVDRYCSEEVREKFIRPAIKGETWVGIATTEAGGGSDVAAFKSVAKRVGEEWVIDGEKMYISGTEEALKLNAGYFILCRTSPAPSADRAHLGMTGFFLPMRTPGVEVTKRFDDMGRMGISTGGFVMKGIRLSDAYRVGDVGKGFYISMEGFDLARLLIAAICVGAAQRALEIGMDYIKERKAFGFPLGKFEAIQFELADLTTELEAARALVYRTAWMVDERYKRQRFTPLECSKFIAMSKLKTNELAFRIFEKTMLWLGAYGYTKECPLEMGFRGVMSFYIGAEGTMNVMRIIIARELLGREFVPYRGLVPPGWYPTE